MTNPKKTNSPKKTLENAIEFLSSYNISNIINNSSNKTLDEVRTHITNTESIGCELIDDASFVRGYLNSILLIDAIKKINILKLQEGNKQEFWDMYLKLTAKYSTAAINSLYLSHEQHTTFYNHLGTCFGLEEFRLGERGFNRCWDIYKSLEINPKEEHK